MLIGKSILASIPRINLLKLRAGDVIRPAGKTWQILKATAEGVEVEPGSRGAKAKDFMYPGGGMNLDPMVLERVRKAIFEDAFEQNYYRPIEQKQITAYVEPLRKTCRVDSIPFARMPVGFTYLTFAGERINRAISLIAQEPDIKVTETTLTSLARIKWENVSDNPKDYELHYPSLFKSGEDQTFFHTLLPERLQRHEYSQSWLKDQSVVNHLARLRRSTPVEVDRRIIEQFTL